MSQEGNTQGAMLAPLLQLSLGRAGQALTKVGGACCGEQPTLFSRKRPSARLPLSVFPAPFFFFLSQLNEFGLRGVLGPSDLRICFSF